MLFQEMLIVYLDLFKTSIPKIFWKAFIGLEPKYWLILYKLKKISLINYKRMKTMKLMLPSILHSSLISNFASKEVLTLLLGKRKYLKYQKINSLAKAPE